MQLLVPEESDVVVAVNKALLGFCPGIEEMLIGEDRIEWVEHFTDRNFLGKQPKEGYQVVKIQCWYYSKTATESMWTDA